MLFLEEETLNLLLERVFENRNIDSDFWNQINTQPYGCPKDTDKLCAILKYYHDTQNLLVLLTDFDNDGIMCGVEGFAGFAELGFNVALFIPDVTEGYGFDGRTIDRIVAKYPNVKGILTADVGITCYEGIQRARALGLDMLVTDHHETGAAIAANVFVDPTRPDEDSGYAHICGAAVLYHVLLYYAQTYGNPYQVSQIRRLSIFAGCGTISDSMPVYYENRQLIRDAITIFKLVYSDEDQSMVNSIPGCDIYRRAFLGLFVLMKAFKENGNALFSETPIAIHEDFIGFYMAPVFNSIKRMEADVAIVYRVFFGPEPLKDMQVLLELNEERKILVEEKTADLLDEVYPQPWKPYIYITDARPGICGLLAQKMLDVTGEPVMVVTSDVSHYRGSGRCPSWYPFLDIAISEDWYAAGHNPAFGIGFDDEAGADALYAFLKKTIPQLKPDVDAIKWKPDFLISMFDDGDAGFDVDLLHEYLEELERCRPFGPGFPEPEAKVKINTKMVEFSVMGKNKNHLKIHLPCGISAVCFGQASVITEHGVLVKPDKEDESHIYPYWIATDLPDCMELSGRFAYNTYNGVTTIQFLGQVMTEN